MFGLPQAKSRLSFGEAFEAAFPRLSALQRGFRADGLLAAAVTDTGQVGAYLHVRVGPEPVFATVGRHDLCGLVLDADPAVSLRHAVISARAEGGELELRLLDLHSEIGLETEEGERCHSVRADGALFVGIGSYRIFLLPTGTLSPLPWCATAPDSWASIPERIYRDQRLAARSRRPRSARVQQLGKGPGRSIITEILEPPGLLRARTEEGEATLPPVAKIELATAMARESYTASDEDLARGLLVGRYDRCQLGAADTVLSRVHLLLLREHGSDWAIDTASTNGTQVGQQPIAVAPLAPETDLLLAQRITLAWRRL